MSSVLKRGLIFGSLAALVAGSAVFVYQLWFTTPNPKAVIVHDIRVGSGPEVTRGKMITVHYVGKAENGAIFESSRERRQTFSFILGAGQVLNGWEEGLKGMRKGGIRRLAIPSKFAYGQRGVPGKIAPDTLLFYEIEVLGIQDYQRTALNK